MMTPEARLKKECRKYMRDRGAYVFCPVQMGYGSSTLDDLVCWKGKFVAIEYKVGKNKMTARQQAIADAINGADGWAVVVRELRDLQEWLAMLEEHNAVMSDVRANIAGIAAVRSAAASQFDPESDPEGGA